MRRDQEQSSTSPLAPTGSTADDGAVSPGELQRTATDPISGAPELRGTNIPAVPAAAPAQPPAAPLPPALDQERLLELVGNDPSLRDTVLAVFARELPTQLEAVNAAYQARDLTALHRAAHRLKGALLSVCAPMAAEALAAVEQAAKGSDTAALGPMMNAVLTQVGRVRAAVSPLEDLS